MRTRLYSNKRVRSLYITAFPESVVSIARSCVCVHVHSFTKLCIGRISRLGRGYVCVSLYLRGTSVTCLSFNLSSLKLFIIVFSVFVDARMWVSLSVFACRFYHFCLHMNTCFHTHTDRVAVPSWQCATHTGRVPFLLLLLTEKSAERPGGCTGREWGYFKQQDVGRLKQDSRI